MDDPLFTKEINRMSIMAASPLYKDQQKLRFYSVQILTFLSFTTIQNKKCHKNLSANFLPYLLVSKKAILCAIQCFKVRAICGNDKKKFFKAREGPGTSSLNFQTPSPFFLSLHRSVLARSVLPSSRAARDRAILV